MSPLRDNALVIGGGVAGASAALLLAQAGRRVTLLERTATAQPKVCGEFLSQEALDYLECVGVDVVELGAVSIERVRLAGNRVVAEAVLPFRSMSLSRLRLDEALLARAAEAGVRVLRGRRVDSLLRDSGAEVASPVVSGIGAGLAPARDSDGGGVAGAGGGVGVQGGSALHADSASSAGSSSAFAPVRPRNGWIAETVSGEHFRASDVLLATGKHDLHGWARPPGVQNNLVAFKMYWRLAPAQQAELAGCVELLVFPGGYAGLQPVEDGMANLCLLVTRAVLQGLGGGWPALLEYLKARAAHLARRLDGAAAVLERPLALSSIPYGYVRPRAGSRRGEAARDALWRLGDQTAVIPSFSGDGMSIALHSARLAVGMLLAGESAASCQRTLAAQLRGQVRLATALSRALVAAPTPLLLAARLWPGLLGVVAAGTRIRPGSLLVAPRLPAEAIRVKPRSRR